MIQWISDNWVTLVALWGALHTLASLVTSLTPTPKDDEVVRKFYRIIEMIALLFGKAKE